MNLLYQLKQKLQQHILRIVENERQIKEHNNLVHILSTIDCNPDKVFFESVAQFLGGVYIHIGDCTNFGHGIYLTAWDKYQCLIDGNEVEQHFSPELSIGNSCHFGAHNHISCINRISIGDNLLTGKWVTITDNSHGLTDTDSLHIDPIKRPLASKGPVIIGNNVWIGDKATILPGVIIGDGAVIGANTVVATDIPEFCIVVGNPARIIRK